MRTNFQSKILEENEEFNSLFEMFGDTSRNENVSKSKRLLRLLNYIIDYYIGISNDDTDIKLPIIYFPICEPWAQSLCEEFVAFKMTFYFGEKTKEKIHHYCQTHPYLTETEALTNEQKKTNKRKHELKRKLNDSYSNITIYPAQQNEKCLIFSRYLIDLRDNGLLSGRNYSFLQEFVGAEMTTNRLNQEIQSTFGGNFNITRKSVFSDKFSVSLIEDDEEQLRADVIDNKGNVKIPNIFVFLQRDLDGRNADLVHKISADVIDYYNRQGAGVKNVILILFSKKPYRLQRGGCVKRYKAPDTPSNANLN